MLRFHDCLNLRKITFDNFSSRKRLEGKTHTDVKPNVNPLGIRMLALFDINDCSGINLNWKGEMFIPNGSNVATTTVCLIFMFFLQTSCFTWRTIQTVNVDAEFVCVYHCLKKKPSNSPWKFCNYRLLI